jgi:mediator of RNA polymerase II transcription subunit 12, fungi type
VIPRSWDDYHDLVSSCLNLEQPIDGAVFQNLTDRNARVQPAKHSRSIEPESSQQRIIQIFDAACSSHDINALSEACLSIADDQASLISRLLEWVATSFRHGLVRVYIAVRLLRKWRKLGIDIDSHILSYLKTVEENVTLDMDNVYHVVAELVRSHSFSVAKYLQWLVARGAVGRPQHNTPQVNVAEQVGMLSP